MNLEDALYAATPDPAGSQFVTGKSRDFTKYRARLTPKGAVVVIGPEGTMFYRSIEEGVKDQYASVCWKPR